MFKTLIGKSITIELKNDLVISGELDTIDPYLNMKLTKITVLDEVNHPQMVNFFFKPCWLFLGS